MHFNNDTDLYRTIGSNIKHSCCDKSLSISVLNQIANVLNVEINDFFKEVSI